ncbi:acyl carrier protein [Haliea sp. E1-2-M8]|uniref:acyl carrier protein n=1 Tax=Haliea sp. E1-2-M8 TaxID=3064706 RepID=UPI00272382AE|nr:acyl carrier protein [Haliea sp. E1-2-M8]MDO8861552.1 acyl carrier protein [Haliea sp. E1-2-M8]
MTVTQQGVEDAILEVLKDIVQDWDLELDGQMTPDSLLVANLGFSSVDFVELATSIEDLYPEVELDFDGLIINNGRLVEDLSVSQVAAFVYRRLNGA